MADDAKAESSLNIHPMDQFVVQPLFGGDNLSFYTISNATLWFFIAVAVIFLILITGTRSRQMVPTKSQSVADVI